MPYYRKVQVPDTLYPSNNPEEVPTLDVTKQAKTLDLNVVQWKGLSSRQLRDAKTIHFYTDDKAFNHLLTYPDLLLKTKAINSTEINFSLGEQTPLWFGHYFIYMKRYIARFWQEHGVKIFVDLFVSPKFQDANMVGVPFGWSAFSFRSLESEATKVLPERLNFCADWAENNKPFIFIYGGGRKTRAFAETFGCLWIPDVVDYYHHAGSKKWMRDYKPILTVPESD